MSIDYAGWKVRPVMYQGLRMRSRLEATWAAFFDACGWRWEYEPLGWKRGKTKITFSDPDGEYGRTYPWTAPASWTDPK